MLVSDFDYDLPQELIAQEPLADRSASRMLHLIHPAVNSAVTGELHDRSFHDLPSLLRAGDLVVLNNTRVFPARLFGRRSGARAQPLSQRNLAAREFLQGRVEVLLTRQLEASPPTWQALVRPGRKLGIGERLFFSAPDESASLLEAEIVARGECGERTLRFMPIADFFGALEQIGHIPLPPYIARSDSPADRDRYQTVFASQRGSAAAPTAGLHFTPEILQQLKSRGVETAEITLHVGLGTFQPVHAERVVEHRLHREHFAISSAAAEALNRARHQGRRIVAVGTTVVRTLEFVAANSPEFRAQSGEADIFIYPGFQFRAVGALLTNFHLPCSTLLMLVSAFAGRERVLAAYRHAVAQKYRFYSYGDCMLIE